MLLLLPCAGSLLVTPLDEAKAASLTIPGVSMHQLNSAFVTGGRGFDGSIFQCASRKGYQRQRDCRLLPRHIFVPARQAEEAMLALRQLSSSHTV